MQEREAREEEQRAQDAARLAAIEGAAQAQREEAAALRARLDIVERQRQEQEAARRSLFARLFGLK